MNKIGKIGIGTVILGEAATASYAVVEIFSKKCQFPFR